MRFGTGGKSRGIFLSVKKLRRTLKSMARSLYAEGILCIFVGMDECKSGNKARILTVYVCQ